MKERDRKLVAKRERKRLEKEEKKVAKQAIKGTDTT